MSRSLFLEFMNLFLIKLFRLMVFALEIFQFDQHAGLGTHGLRVPSFSQVFLS